MPSFAQDIRPLFREIDIDEMRFVFDLSQFEDVKSMPRAFMTASLTDRCRATEHGRTARSRFFANAWTRATRSESLPQLPSVS